MPIIDFYCYKPGCLRNSNRQCTGVRMVPSPSTPDPTRVNAVDPQDTIPRPVMIELTRHVRRAVAEELHRTKDMTQPKALIEFDLDFIRRAHHKEQARSGRYVP